MIMPVEVWVIYRLARGCRDGVYGGVMSYGQVLWYVVQLAMYASLISALFRYVYCKVLNPGFLEGQRDSMMVLAEGLPQLEGQMGALEEVFAEVLTPLNMAVQGMWLNLVACVVVGLVVAGVLRRDGSPFDGEDGGGV